MRAQKAGFWGRARRSTRFLGGTNPAQPGAMAHRRTSTLSHLIFFAASSVLGCGAEDPDLEPTGTEADALTPVPITFDYSMPDKFGTDLNDDGIIDLQPVQPSDPARSPVVGNLLRPSAWKVTLDACSSLGGKYVWDVVAPNGVSTRYDAGLNCRHTIQVATQGAYRVTLTATFTRIQLPQGTPSTEVSTATKIVNVKNYLIVSVGDSIASGEGAPDVPIPGGPDGWRGGTLATWSNRQCHRSANSGHARAALALERSDPHSSVTFISLACSGAGVDTGLLNPYFGQEPFIPGTRQLLPRLPSQIDEARRLACPSLPTLLVPPAPCAQVDALLVNAGANDVGFGELVEACGIPADDCRSQAPLVRDYYTKLENLPAAYDRLATRIREKLDVKQVYISEYPDPTHTDSGAYCSEIRFIDAGAGVVDGVINSDEVPWAHQAVVLKLNRAVLAAAQKHGWKPISGIAQDFRKHGYCATDHWMVRYDESTRSQGNIDGTLHPNAAGYEAIARHLLAAVEEETTLPRNRLAAVAHSDSPDLRLFARAYDGVIHQRSGDGVKWRPWQSLGGNMSSAPAALEPAAGQTVVFAVDKTGALKSNVFLSQTNGFSGWRGHASTAVDPDTGSSRSLAFVDTPALARDREGRAHVVAIGDDSRLWHTKVSAGGGWVDSAGNLVTNWTSLNAPPFIGRPSIVADGANELDVVVRGADNAVWHGFLNGGVWSWQSLGGIIVGNPKLTSGAAERLDIFALGIDRAVHHQWGWEGWYWGGWESFGSVATSDPEVVVSGVDQDAIFVRSAAFGLDRKFHWGGAWNSLAAPTTLVSAVHAVMEGAGVEDAFAELSDGTVAAWSLRNGGWSGPTSLGIIGAR
jgi:lysophospholipase L1-like esterase